jgi:hypothetical protein
MRVSRGAGAGARMNSARAAPARDAAARDAGIETDARETPHGIGLIAALTAGARCS